MNTLDNETQTATDHSKNLVSETPDVIDQPSAGDRLSCDDIFSEFGSHQWPEEPLRPSA